MLKKNILLTILVSFSAAFNFNHFIKRHKRHFQIEELNLNREFNNFQRIFNKHYKNGEIQKRKNIFKKNLKETKSDHPNYLFKMGINSYSDLTYKEFSEMYLMKVDIKGYFENLMRTYPEKIKFVIDEDFNFPKNEKHQSSKQNFLRYLQEYDEEDNFNFFQNGSDDYFNENRHYNPYRRQNPYRYNYQKKHQNPKKRRNNSKKRISRSLRNYKRFKSWKHHSSPIKNQHKCASCYAFAAISAIELLNSQNGLNKSPLSEQEIIDCDKENKGCVGGSPTNVFKYISSNGINYSKDYSYKAKENECNKKTDVIRYKKKIITRYIRNPVELIVALNRGPCVLLIHASNNFKRYKNGVFNDPKCSGVLNHAVVAVGYDLNGSVPYVICKNNWGSHWGDNGYIKIALGNVERNEPGICEMFTHLGNVAPSFV